MSLTSEQLATRHLTLGASEIAAVAGMNPYESAHDVWLKKLQLADSEESVHSRMGNRVEACVLEEYRESEGVSTEAVGTLVHPAHSWMSATPDARVVGTRRLVEIKCVGWRMAYQWGTSDDAVPSYYRMQIEQQMEVCDAAECDVAAWIGGSDFRIYRIKRDRELARIVTEIGKRFWHDHVIPRVPPRVDGSAGARRMLDALYPRNTKPFVNATPEIEALVARLAEARESTKAAEASEAEAQNLVIEAINDREGVVTATHRITFRADKNGKRRFVIKERMAS